MENSVIRTNIFIKSLNTLLIEKYLIIHKVEYNNERIDEKNKYYSPVEVWQTSASSERISFAARRALRVMLCAAASFAIAHAACRSACEEEREREREREREK